MTKKVPDVVHNNQIYSFIWNLVNRKDNNAVLLFIGDVGRGKSTGAIRFGTDLDEKFSLDRICFDMKEFLNLITNGDRYGKLRRGSVIVFDEPGGAEMGLDSRTSLSPVNVRASKFATISRAKGFIIIYCIPQMKQLDKRVRSIGVKGVCDFKEIDFKAKRSVANFYFSVTYSFGTDPYRPQPRAVDKITKIRTKWKQITIPLPRDRELVKAYKQKKEDFINASIAKWHKQIAEADKKKEAKTINQMQVWLEEIPKYPEMINEKGKLILGIARIKLNIGVHNARDLKQIWDHAHTIT